MSLLFNMLSSFVMEQVYAATAKSLQSCLTLSDPMDCSLLDSSIHGIFQARVLEWGAIAFSEVYATMYKINKLQGYIVQHKEYSQYLIITLNGI